MRHLKVWQAFAALSLLVLILIVFMSTRSGSLPAAQRFERLGLQSEGAEREERAPLVPIEALSDPIVTLPDAFGTVESLKDVPPVPFQPSTALSREEEPELPRQSLAGDSQPDAVAQTWAGSVNMPSPIANFDGISLANQGASFSPPDTNGDIGYDPATGKRYYFQWINLAYKAWDVTNPAAPVVVLPLASGNALWQAALPGTPCANTNDGDPIVLFDEQAQRWFISQFSVSVPFHQCVAVSGTPNPAGAWYVYDYPYRDGATYFNDYPHFGVWPDATYNAYFMTVHEFNAAGTAYLGQSASAFDRAKLLNGDSAAPLVTFALGNSYGGMLPADLDGLPPASGTPGFFFMTTPAGTLQVWEFKPNWITPASSVFGIGAGHTSNYTLPVAAYTDACDAATCALVPQAGTSRLLDTLGDRLMHRVAFRVLGGITQTAVLNHTVDVNGPGGSTRTGIRWYEVRRNPASGAWSINQQSTYAPGSSEYRWMGSIATDQAGNIALGYSVSSSSSFPSIRYAGRLFTDTLGQLPQAEVTMTVSSGAQTGSSRWGDYSMMGVDPQDGCTFWYTQEYNGATASLPWKTRIGSFKFADCVPVPTSTGALSGTVRNASNNNLISAAGVVALNSSGTAYNATTDGSGIYRLSSLPIGTYTVTASAAGYNAGTATGVSIAAGITTTQNFALTPLSVTDLAITKTGPSFAPAGATLHYTLNVSNNGPLTLGTFTATYTNSATISIPDNSSQMVTSTIAVAGLPTVRVVRAGLLGFTHTYPEDIDTLLVGPGGQTTILMSDPRGGSNPANNIGLQFDDSAAPLPCTSGALAAGAYHPTDCPNDFGNDTFPVPAPAGPYTATLSAFNLVNPNGTWKLFARDDFSGDSGAISGGWTLTLAGAYTVIVTDTLPAGTTFVGATGNGWNCAHASGVVTCTRAALAPGAAPGIAITVTAPLAIGPITNTAVVGSNASDNAPANNTAQFTTNIINGASTYGVSVTPAAAGLSGGPGAIVTYTLAVTNTGNTSDTYMVTVSGNTFTTTKPSNVGPLLGGANTTFDVAVAIPAEAADGTLDVANVKVTSSGDPTKFANSVLTTTVSAIPGVTLVPNVAGRSDLPGAVVTYTLAVTNTGNASDTFTVTVAGNAFATSAPSSVGPLISGAGTTFDVGVTIPAGAIGGSFDSAMVGVTSHRDGNISDNASLTTTVWFGLYLPLTLK